MKNFYKRIGKKNTYAIIISVILAVMLIPMLYSTIYLGAFWDPYGNLDKVSVAFVNMDDPIVKDNNTYSIGKDLEKNLKDNNKVKWEFVNYEEAKNGVNGTKYYAMIVIPKDFSKKISDAVDGKTDKATFIYEANKGRNFIFYQVSSKVSDALKNEVNASIAKETSKALIDNLYDMKNSLNDANNGVEKLLDGTNKLKDGGFQLKDGLIQASNAEKQLLSGYDSLIDGLNQFNAGVSQKDSRVDQLVSGASKISEGAASASKNTADLSNNVTLIKNAAIGANANLSQGLNNAAAGVTDVGNNIAYADSMLGQSTMADISSGKLTQDDIQAIITVKAILDGINKKDINKNIAAPLSASANAAAPLVDNLTKLEQGSKQLAGGLNVLAEKSDQFSNGMSQLSQGLTEKQNNASNGVNKLIAGANQLKDGTNKLADGTSKLLKGSIALSDGITSADNGVSELKDGIGTGYNKLNNKLNFKPEDMAKFISDSVKMDDISINDVKYYGEGLAPYFISLSLWLGAMFINIIITLARFADVVKNKFLKTFTGKFIIGSVYASLQAIILSFALIKVLKMDSVNITTFYITNMLISVAFFGFMYGISYAIGALSSAILFIIMLLQLASCGGTFPIETAPYFYRIMNKILPMTYSVKLLRMATSGINELLFKENIIIMLQFMFGSLIIGFIVRVAITKLKELKIRNQAKNLEAA